MNWKSVWIIAGAWAALFSAGGWAGKRFSPDWGNPGQVKVWAASRLQFRPDGPDGKPSGNFSFRCGPDTFAYRIGAPAPEIGNAPGVWQGKEPERKPLSSEDIKDLANLLGLPALVTAPAMIEGLKSLESKNYMVAMAVGALAGFGLGVYLSYDPNPSCPEVKTALADPAFWRSLEAPKTVQFYAKGVVVYLSPEQKAMYHIAP